MKQSMYMYRIGLMLLCSMFFSYACSDDSDDKILDDMDNVINPTDNVEDKWREEGNKIIYTVEFNDYYWNYSAEYTITFDGDEVSDAVCVYTFPSSDLASLFEESLRDDGEQVTRSGKKVTENVYEEFAEMTKDEVRALVQGMTEYT